MTINMTTKVLSGLLAIFAIYLLVTFYISIKTLNIFPDQLFLSETIKPAIVELENDNLDNLTNEIENINFVVVFTKDKKATYYVTNAKDYSIGSDQSTLADTILQYTSGSNLVFAGNCPNMMQYKHGTCTGPTYDSGGHLVAPAVCTCVPR